MQYQCVYSIFTTHNHDSNTTSQIKPHELLMNYKLIILLNNYCIATKIFLILLTIIHIFIIYILQYTFKRYLNCYTFYFTK